MLTEIKKTTRHTFIYAFGNIATKVIGIILIPLYTNANYLSHDDFGALAVLEATFQVLVGILAMAMRNSLSRWYWDPKFASSQRSIFFTTIFFLTITILPAGVLLIYFAENISHLLFQTIDYSYLLQLTIMAAILQTINNQTLQLIKLQSKSVLFSSLQIAKFSLILCLILWGIIHNGKGLNAIWEANLIGESLTLIALLPYIIKNSVRKFQRSVLKEMLQYGFPLMLASVSGVLLATADRYMLSSMSGLEKTGIYSLGYRISSTLKVVITASISSALTPLRSKKLDEPNNHRFFSKNLTYVSFIFMVGLLAVSLFSLELIKSFTSSKIYWEATYIVPLIGFGLFFGLMKDYSSAGVYIKKKSSIIAIFLVSTTVLNIALNFFLIPLWDIYGAATATLISQLFFFIVIVYSSQKHYYIPYEWLKILKMTLTATTILGISLLVSDLDVVIRLIIKILLFCIFPFILYYLNFFDKIEIENIQQILKNWKNFKNIKTNIKRFLK